MLGIRIGIVAALVCAAPGAAGAAAEAPLADAVMRQDHEAVRTLLAAGADLDAPRGDGMTALHWAARHGDLPTARRLLAADADVEAVTRLGRHTPLHVAGRAGHAPVVAALLDHGADAEALTSAGAAPLHFAAQSGSAGAVEALLARGADPDAREARWGQTPLMFAAGAARTEVVAPLLRWGADPGLTATVVNIAARDASDRADSRQRRARLVAERAGRSAGRRLAAASTWLRSGTANRAGRSAGRRLAAASAWLQSGTAERTGGTTGRSRVAGSAEPHSETAERATGRRRVAGSAASRSGVAERAGGTTGRSRVAGSAGPRTEAAERAGRTAERRRAAGARWRRTGSARPRPAVPAPRRRPASPRPAPADETDRQEEPEPLGYADLVGTHGGLTALLLAARDGHADTAAALIAGGADVNQVSAADGTSPLLIAAINGHFDLALRLLKSGADPRLASGAGATPLYGVLNMQWAPKARHPQPTDHLQQAASYLDVMRALIEAGADVNARLEKSLWYTTYNRDLLGVDRTGATAFWRAAYALDVEAMKLLLEYGADSRLPTVTTPVRRLPAHPDPSGLRPVPLGGPAVSPLLAAAGVGHGQGYAGNSHRHVPGGWLPAVRFLVEEVGLDVHFRDHNGYNAVHHAAARGDNALIRYLVDRGVDVTQVSRRGQTTVDMANGPVQRIQPYPDTIALLESLGAKNNHRCLSC